jgi:hypothetical protein
MKKASRFYNDPVDEARDKRYDDELEKKNHPEIYEAEFNAMYEHDRKYFPWVYEGRE